MTAITIGTITSMLGMIAVITMTIADEKR